MARIGPYEVVSELGRGGMGVVYRARHAELDHEVALKVILAGPDGASGSAIARFETEAQAAGRLSGHPNVVAVTDFGRHDGNLYLAMEFVQGTPLDALIDQGELSHEAAARAVAQTARALQHAHDAGVLHRDVKPANVLMDTGTGHDPAGPRARLADFGLARQQAADADVTRLTQSGELLGTPAYMPPEQAKGQGIDARADVYSAGATLYACLTGVPPFHGDSVFAVIAGVMRNEPEPPRTLAPETPPGLEAITLKCLEKDPAERYQSAAALADDLDRWLAGEAITARERTGLEQAARSLKRNRHPVLIGAGVLTAAALLGAGAWHLSQGQETTAAKLQQETAELTDAERAGRVARVWQRLQRDSGAAMSELEDASQGVEVADAARRRAFAVVQAAVGAAREAAPEVQAAAAWEALALHFLGRATEAAAQLDAAVATADPVVDPLPRLLQARVALNGYVAALEPPEAQVGSARVKLGALQELPAQQKALARAKAALEPIPDAAWERLKEAVDDRRFAAAAAAVAARNWEEAETALQPLADAPGLAAPAGMLGGVAAFSRERFDAAAGWFAIAADRGWPRAHALAGLAHMARAIRHHNSGRDPGPALEAAAGHLTTASADPTLRYRALEDLAFVHLIDGTWAVNDGRDGVAALERAIGVLDAMLDLNADDSETWTSRALAREFIGRWKQQRGDDPLPHLERASQDLERARTIAPRNAAVWIGAGRVHLLVARQKQWSGADPADFFAKALEHAERAVNLTPGSGAAQAALADVRRAQADWKLRSGRDPSDDLRVAQDLLEGLVQGRPGDGPAHRDLAGFYLLRSTWAERTGEDRGPWLDKALEQYGLAIAANPEDAMALSGRAGVHHQRGRERDRRGADPREAYRAAIRDYTAAIARVPGNSATVGNRGYTYMDLARLAARHGEDPTPLFEQALADYASAVELEPTRGDVWGNVGMAWIDRAQYLRSQRRDPSPAHAKAVEAFGHAIRLNPNDAVAYSQRGQVYLMMAKLLRDASDPMRRAIQDHDTAVRLNPRDVRLRNSRAIHHLEAAHMVRAAGGDPGEHYRKAIEDCDAMIALNDRYLFAYMNRTRTCDSLAGWIIEQGGDGSVWLQRAYESAKRAFTLAPRRPDLARSYGYACERTGRLEEAFQAYAQGLQLREMPWVRQRHDALARKLGK